MAFSGGKSSLAALDIVAQHVPPGELLAYYIDTGNEYPGNAEYVREVAARLGVRLAVVRSRVSPWAVWRALGFPRPSRDRYYTPACCAVLKELPAAYVIERYGVNVDFTGIQASEALHRLRSLADYGLVRRTDYVGREARLRRAIVRAAPVGIWTDADVWRYVRERGLPVNPVYARFGVDRQGCVVCTNHLNWRERLERYRPELARYVEERMREWGVQEARLRLGEVLARLGVGDPRGLYEVYEVAGKIGESLGVNLQMCD